MNISLIVAVSNNSAIGKNNELLWHLPNDLKYFKNTTWAMPVIMGRKTFESLSGKALPGRYNIVVSRQPDHGITDPNVWVVSSIEEAIVKAKETDCKEAFVAGGGQIYDAFLPLANKIYITRVHADVDGDTYFPTFSERTWCKVFDLPFKSDEKHLYSYNIEVWKNT